MSRMGYRYEPPREAKHNGWRFKPGEGCEHRAPGAYGTATCPWRGKVTRKGKRYCGVHDPAARSKRAKKALEALQEPPGRSRRKPRRKP